MARVRARFECEDKKLGAKRVVSPGQEHSLAEKSWTSVRLCSYSIRVYTAQSKFLFA